MRFTNDDRHSHLFAHMDRRSVARPLPQAVYRAVYAETNARIQAGANELGTKGAFFTLQAAARHVADNGRIIYVGSSNTRFPRPGFGLYGGSKLAPQFLVEVLAKEIGAKGITVNSILPTATEGAGVSAKGVRPQAREFIKNHNPMQRMATLEDVANAAEYLAGDSSAYVSGQHLLLSGGAPA